MYYLNESPLENYFPNQDTVLQIDTISPSLQTNAHNDQLRHYYEFIPYHPVSVLYSNLSRISICFYTAELSTHEIT